MLQVIVWDTFTIRTNDYPALGSLRKEPLANGSFVLRRSFPPTCCANKNSGRACWYCPNFSYTVARMLLLHQRHDGYGALT